MVTYLVAIVKKRCSPALTKNSLVKDLGTWVWFLSSGLFLVLVSYPMVSDALLMARTKNPHPRPIYFKLPLEQPEYHWTFMDRDAFLSGRLVLQITRGNESQTIIVFESGELSNAWKEMDDDDKPGNRIYFGFVSQVPFPVSRLDSVELILNVPEDLEGCGNEENGVLKAGEYRSKGTFTFYSAKSGDNVYLTKENWDTLWKLDMEDNGGGTENRYPRTKSPNSIQDDPTVLHLRIYKERQRQYHDGYWLDPIV
jgi:hypothetical protein